MDEALQLSEIALQQKGISYGWAIKKFQNESEIIEKEISRLRHFKERAERIAEVLKEKLSEGMTMYGIEKIETPTLKLSFRKSEAVNIIDEKRVPAEFLDFHPATYSVSKTKIKDALKSGIEVKGAELITRQNLQIK